MTDFIKRTLSDFFEKFPLKNDPTETTPSDLLTGYLWLKGLKIGFLEDFLKTHKRELDPETLYKMWKEYLSVEDTLKP